MLRFLLADVTHPLISVDFLSHFGLLVDCKHNRLLDEVTSLSVPAQAANSLIPSINNVSGGTPVDSLLAQFLDFARLLESSAKYATITSITSGLYQAHWSPADQGD
jgi:hypothetical protein